MKLFPLLFVTYDDRLNILLSIIKDVWCYPSFSFLTLSFYIINVIDFCRNALNGKCYKFEEEIITHVYTMCTPI